MNLNSRWIPANATPIEHPQQLAIAYAYPIGQKWGLIAYRGKATKAAFHYSYSNAEKMHNSLTEWFDSLSAMFTDKLKERELRKLPHTLKVGQIVVNSWGWEQTNVDFYEVVCVSPNYVWLEAIGNSTVEDSTVSHGMADHRVANPKLRTGRITKHAADRNNYVCFPHGSGSVWDGSPKYCSWYA